MSALCVRLVIGFPNPGKAAVVSAFTARRHASDSAPARPPVGGTGAKLPTLKRGTGGRSSFSGVVATIFGCTGFLGGILANRLGKIGTQLVLPYRGEFYAVQKLKVCGDLGQVLFQFVDLRDEISLAKAMKYSNVVINLIGKDTETRNFSLEDVNVKGARTIARIARESGVQKLIHFSSLNVAENPKPVIKPSGSKFLATKWLGEQVVQEEFPGAIIFRPSDMYEHTDNYLTYYTSIWRRTVTLIPLWKRGKGIYKQPVFVSDVAKGVVNAIFEEDNAGTIYQAVGPRRYELGELVDYMFRIMRREPKDGYIRYDMRFDPFFWARVQMSETIWKHPLLSWERLEREHTSDEVLYEHPTLEDLSVPLTYVEDRFPYELKYWRHEAYYDPNIAQFEKVRPPPVIED